MQSTVNELRAIAVRIRETAAIYQQLGDTKEARRAERRAQQWDRIADRTEKEQEHTP